MTLDSMIAQFIGLFQGLLFSVFIFIYLKLRERIARLEWSLDAGKKTESEPKRKKPKEA